jgi:DNA repair protein RecO (recombination protein O)
MGETRLKQPGASAGVGTVGCLVKVVVARIALNVPVEITSPAYVLRTRPYGELDVIATLLTETHGKLAGIAKAAKHSRRRFGGTLQPFVRVRAVFRQRPHTDLAFLVRCELLAPLRTFSEDVERYAAGSYVLDLVDRMTVGRDSGHEVYRLLDEALVLLDRGTPAAEPLLRAFELHLLAASGYAPALDRCRGCGADLAAHDTAFLVVERGGLACRRCVPPGEIVRPVTPSTARVLAALATRPLADAAGAGAIPHDARAVAEHLLASVTSGPLRSRAFLARLRVDSPSPVR